MTIRKSWIGLAVASVLVLPVLAIAQPTEDPATTFAKGKDLLKKGDFNGALKLYAIAARADSTKTEYRMEYSVLRQVITLRDGLAKEKNAEKWQTSALKLRTFYYRNDLFAEALPLDTELHTRLKSADSATMLASTYLVLGKNAEAEKLLGGLEAAKATAQTKVMLGIAMARQNKMDAAKALSGKIELAKDTGPGLMYDLACLKALTGQKAEAAALLARSFENTPPSRIDAMKKAAREDKDLMALVATPELAAAMKAESKVKESKCSGGGDCGSCASKGKCSSSAGGAGCAEKAGGACPESATKK